MRVISGKNKATKLYGYDTVGVRPTMDKVKESIFAIISSKIKGSICLDLFSGTGSIGIELLSNGADKVYFNDISDASINVTKKNIDKTNNFSNSVITKSDYKTFIKKTNEKFDIIFLDPPYGVIKISDVIDKIIEYNILNDDGIIICEYESEEFKDFDLDLIKEKKYGNTLVRIYKKR